MSDPVKRYDPGMSGADERWMRRALALAARGRGTVEPNPMVGCVIVREGRVLGEGYHKKFGGPHAEVEALRSAAKRGADVADADVFVTLEPCCHHGKTPPCTDALIAARPARVVMAMIDPYEKVSGRGVAALRAAGIAVEVGLCGGDAARLNEAFIKRVRTGLPWVTAKWAQTLDGKTAAADGSSKWISGEESRAWVHAQRGRVDAVMVGIGTVLADDPLLTARPARMRDVRRVARRVIVDPALRLPESSRLLATLKDAPLTVVVTEKTLEREASRVESLRSRGVEVIGVKTAAGERVADLEGVMRHLVSAHGATHVLVEGGATLSGRLVSQGLVDAVVAFVSPKLLGDDAAVSAVRGLPSGTIDQAERLELRTVDRMGDDVRLEYVVKRGQG